MNGWLVSKRLLELGLSPEEFAVKLGCSISTVYNMKYGKRVSARVAYRAATVLGVDLSDLVTKDPESTKSGGNTATG